jgi:hypothetical protein
MGKHVLRRVFLPDKLKDRDLVLDVTTQQKDRAKPDSYD